MQVILFTLGVGAFFLGLACLILWIGNDSNDHFYNE